MARTDLDSAIMNDPAGRFGAEAGAFLIPFIVGYLLLRAASHPGRRRGTAIVFRVLAVAGALLFSYFGYVGGGRVYFPLGGAIAVLVIAIWAVVGALKSSTSNTI